MNTPATVHQPETVDLRIHEWLERQDEEAESGSLLPPRGSMEAPSDEDHAQFLIRSLYGPYLQVNPELLIELRAIWPKAQLADLGKGESPILSHIFHFSEFADYFRRTVKVNRRGYGIYLGINPRPPSGKKEQDDIRDIVCLWMDMDGKNFKGGKPEAWVRISEFPIAPTIIVDSGNGYHPYWILEEPIINRTDEETAACKQTMVGLAGALGGDAQVRNIDRIFRLPGTLNTKDKNDPKPVRIVRASPERLYSLGDFDEYRDHKFEEPLPTPTMDGVEFKGLSAPISDKDFRSADADVKKLNISPRTKRMIITGDLQKENGKDRTRSGRDMSIMCSLVYGGYGFETARAIFLNKHLGCSDRTLEDRSRAEQNLRYDFSQAVEFMKTKASAPTPQVRAIRDIKAIAEMTAEDKLRQVRVYVVGDLFGNVGLGFKNEAMKKKFFFNTGMKMLLDINSGDFKCFLRDRYDLPMKDMIEVWAGVETKIWAVGQEIEPYNFARYEDQTGVLYISNHDNSVFRLDGESVQVVDNGTDGVIFEYRPEYVPMDPQLPLQGVSYFAGGFDWDCCKSQSLLAKHLIDKTSFAVEAKHNLQPEEQRYLLALYFYSLFFESILEEKPIVCWTGVKASGKGLVSTAIGKILFGAPFLPSHLPDDLRDFQVALIDNYYLVLDNVDSVVRSPVTDALCRAATGERIAKRKLYTDSDELKIRPRVFLAITSRDPRFKRDDLVDRLVIFNTAKIVSPKSRAFLFKSILDARPALWAEILTNLNTIVAMLRNQRNWNPAGIFRIADWELFCKKVSDKGGQAYLGLVLDKMNKEKAHFGLEDDPLYILLHRICFDQDEEIASYTAGDLHARLTKLDDKAFSLRYKTSTSMAKRLNNSIEELRNEFDIYIVTQRRGAEYTISAKKEEEPNRGAAVDAVDKSMFPMSSGKVNG